jgi:hypothetical protein
MKRSLTRTVAAAGIAVGLTLGTAAAASAAPAKPAKPNTACMQAGIATLKGAGLLPGVARNGIEVVDVGVLPLSTVLELHRNSPELFQTGGVSVKVGDVVIPATWCDGL